MTSRQRAIFLTTDLVMAVAFAAVAYVMFKPRSAEDMRTILKVLFSVGAILLVVRALTLSGDQQS